MKKNQPITSIIYKRLLYKDIITIIIAAILFFIITIYLFISYQIKVANIFSDQVEISLNNLVSNAYITKNIMQRKYDNKEEVVNNKKELMDELRTVLLTQKVITFAGYDISEPLFSIDMQAIEKGKNNYYLKIISDKVYSRSNILFQLNLIKSPKFKKGYWENPEYLPNYLDNRPKMIYRFPIFDSADSKLIADVYFAIDTDKFYKEISGSTQKKKLINKYYLVRVGPHSDTKGKFFLFSGKADDNKFLENLANKLVKVKPGNKKESSSWYLSSGYLYYIDTIKITDTVEKYHKHLSATVLYQIDLRKVTAIILLIETIIIAILLIFGLLSIRSIKNNLTKLLRPLKIITNKTQEISNGNFDIKIEEKSDGYDINLLTKSINNMCQNLKSLSKKEKENIKIQTEIKLAQQIQASFVQKNKDNIKVQLGKDYVLEINTVFLAGNLISGDIYDISKNENKIDMFIGDTVGKDMAAAIFSLIVMSQYKAIQKNSPPKNIAKELNTFICEQNKESMFISAAFLSIDITKQTITISNAGHPNPIVINNKSKDAQIFELKVNPLLGINNQGKFQQNTINLKENPEIIIYTDGVTESFDKNNNTYGEKRLVDTINKFKKSKKSKLLEHIRNDIKSFTNKEDKLDDDLTMMHIKICKSK